MIKRAAGTILASLLVLLAWSHCRAGFFYLILNQHSTSNLFQDSAPVTENISYFSLALDSGGQSFSWLADLSFSYFDRNRSLCFLSGGLGFDYVKSVGKRSAVYLYFGVTGSDFREEYEPFSSLGFKAAGAFKSYITQTSILNTGWSGEYRSFRDSLFDYLGINLQATIDKYLKTRTTLKGGLFWGYKYFLHPFMTDSGQTSTPASPGLEVSRPARPRYIGGHGFVPRYTQDGGGAGLGYLAASFLVSQSLGYTAGINAFVHRQWNISGGSPFLSVEEFYYVANPTTDEYSWEGWKMGGRLTLELPWDIEMKMGYTGLEKIFPGVESMALDGTSLGLTRRDTRDLFEGRLEKLFRRFSLFFAFAYINNRSTDPHFNWKAPSFQAGFQWNIPFGRKE